MTDLKTCNCRRGKLALKNVLRFCQAPLCVFWSLNRTAVRLVKVSDVFCAEASYEIVKIV